MEQTKIFFNLPQDDVFCPNCNYCITATKFQIIQSKQNTLNHKQQSQQNQYQSRLSQKPNNLNYTVINSDPTLIKHANCQKQIQNLKEEYKKLSKIYKMLQRQLQKILDESQQIGQENCKLNKLIVDLKMQLEESRRIQFQCDNNSSQFCQENIETPIKSPKVQSTINYRATKDSWSSEIELRDEISKKQSSISQENSNTNLYLRLLKRREDIQFQRSIEIRRLANILSDF